MAPEGAGWLRKDPGDSGGIWTALNGAKSLQTALDSSGEQQSALEGLRGLRRASEGCRDFGGLSRAPD
eukprot:3130558-Alexandrium_andersonii.AAC.1